MTTAVHPWNTYPLPSGTVTDHGRIERLSDTAYLVDGRWVPHATIHGPRGWAEPLIILTDGPVPSGYADAGMRAW